MTSEKRKEQMKNYYLNNRNKIENTFSFKNKKAIIRDEMLLKLNNGEYKRIPDKKLQIHNIIFHNGKYYKKEDLCNKIKEDYSNISKEINNLKKDIDEPLSIEKEINAFFKLEGDKLHDDNVVYETIMKNINFNGNVEDYHLVKKDRRQETIDKLNSNFYKLKPYNMIKSYKILYDKEEKKYY